MTEEKPEAVLGYGEKIEIAPRYEKYVQISSNLSDLKHTGYVAENRCYLLILAKMRNRDGTRNGLEMKNYNFTKSYLKNSHYRHA